MSSFDILGCSQNKTPKKWFSATTDGAPPPSQVACEPWTLAGAKDSNLSPVWGSGFSQAASSHQNLPPQPGFRPEPGRCWGRGEGRRAGREERHVTIYPRQIKKLI